ncbi:hypothetical protein PSHT_06871 [Puccinia striiformis]|uniref:Uncharacterized protein n=2 Tax=Puccinia striiformis TaxID=27350 RepID=A0A2S4VDM7_9BASI|nr:hypothetical protein PSTT_08128 [Puccinia striiformis]POW15986.1 hypothetical protein PSHT_06871 [Puccinia striiformis]
MRPAFNNNNYVLGKLELNTAHDVKSSGHASPDLAPGTQAQTRVGVPKREAHSEAQSVTRSLLLKDFFILTTAAGYVCTPFHVFATPCWLKIVHLDAFKSWWPLGLTSVNFILLSILCSPLRIMKARLEPLVIFLSFTILYLTSIAEGYLITTTICQIDELSAAIDKQDVNEFHISTPKLLNECLFPSGHIDVDAVLALIAARLSYIPFFNEVKAVQIHSGSTDLNSKDHNNSSHPSIKNPHKSVERLGHTISSFKDKLSQKFHSKLEQFKKEHSFE